MTSLPSRLPWILAFGGGGVLALVVGALFHVLFGGAANPDTTLLTLLKVAEHDGLRLVLPGAGELVSTQARYARVSVHVEPSRQTARAVGTLDFTGKLGKTKVSSLGLEQVLFVHEQGRWSPPRGLAPQLAQVVELLERRRLALEAADAPGLRALYGPLQEPASQAELEQQLATLQRMRGRRYEALAWYIRSERDRVQVTESYRLQGTLPERPVDERGERALWLRRTEAGCYFSVPPE